MCGGEKKKKNQATDWLARHYRRERRRREEVPVAGIQGSKEVERLLLSSSKPTVNNAGNYQGRQKKKRSRGRGRGGGDGAEGRKGRREEGREGGGKKERRRRRVNITALWQANMRCWDTSTTTKKKAAIHTARDTEKTRGRGRGRDACACVEVGSRDAEKK